MSDLRKNMYKNKRIETNRLLTRKLFIYIGVHFDQR